jgi:hypothetical protein
MKVNAEKEYFIAGIIDSTLISVFHLKCKVSAVGIPRSTTL